MESSWRPFLLITHKMKLINFIMIVQVVYHCEGQTTLQMEGDGDNATLNGEFSAAESYVVLQIIINKCSWSLGNGSGDSVLLPLTPETRDTLTEQICQDLGCGGFSDLTEDISSTNDTCLQGCVHQDRQLLNCSKTIEGNCTAISEVVCDHQLVRLVGGADRCAGRVELKKQGQWGTVCDDQWDLKEGHVVCAQHNCGYALNVTGQGGSFPQGSGPLYLDELNCTGAEGNLWACPTVEESHDCGHKEDAGVVCSEMRAVRLTGGADRCSGKVEIHRNGTWGTVCDNCWGKEEASMVCSMLSCGEDAQQYKQFIPPLTHNNQSLWYYACKTEHKDLWECAEYVNNKIYCSDSKAAGLICTGSLGFAVVATTPDTSLITTWMTADTTTDRPIESWFHSLSSLSPEKLGCITLSFILLIVLIVNFVLCHRRRRNAHIVQQRHTSLQMSPVHQANDYREPVDLVKVTTNPVEGTVTSDPRHLWTQLSSVDSTSLDTDYEQCDPSNEPSVHLSTFRNSQRYRQDTRNPLMTGSALNSLSEEAAEARNGVPGFLTSHNNSSLMDDYSGVLRNPIQNRNPSEDSFDSSSTSSGECYENGDVVCMETPGITETPSFNNDQLHSESQTINRQDPGVTDEDSEQDGPLYSPVSPDSNDSSTEDDYDDIGQC